MSQRVKIPECSNPFEVTVNGRKYKYEAGIETDVPDDVAKAIEKHHKEHKKEPPEAKAPFGAINFNDLKDKPFYEELTREEAIAETTITISNGECEGLEWENNDYEAQSNNKIIVIFDGVEYPTTFTKDSDDITYLTWQLADGTTMQIIDGVKIATSSSLDGEHTFKAVISDSYVETVHPLDEKYLPDSVKGYDAVVYYDKVPTHEAPTSSNITRETYKTLKRILERGGLPRILIINEYMYGSFKYNTYTLATSVSIAVSETTGSDFIYVRYCTNTATYVSGGSFSFTIDSSGFVGAG